MAANTPASDVIKGFASPLGGVSEIIFHQQFL
jgi:hypothetical protein